MTTSLNRCCVSQSYTSKLRCYTSNNVASCLKILNLFLIIVFLKKIVSKI